MALCTDTILCHGTTTAAGGQDEFEEYRARSYSAGASNKPEMFHFHRRRSSRKNRSRHSSIAANQQDPGMVRTAPAGEEADHRIGVTEMDISEDTKPVNMYDVTTRLMDTLSINRAMGFDHRLSAPDTARLGRVSPSISPNPGRHYRSLSCRRPRRPTELEGLECRPRSRTSSMPSKGHLKRPDPSRLRDSYTRRSPEPSAFVDTDYEFYRVRSFTTTSKGIINRGDALKLRPSSSQASLDSIGSVGSGCRAPAVGDSFRRYSASSQGSVSRMSTGSSPESNDPDTYTVLICGSQGVGKTAITQQFTTSESVSHEDAAFESRDNEKRVSVLLDGMETTLCIIDISTDDDPWTIIEEHAQIDAYVVVYSVCDRESFDDAVEVLHELRKDRTTGGTAVILTANKIDIARTRDVTEEQGKQMAIRYDSKYIEVSAIINLKIDELLVGIIRQILLKRGSSRAGRSQGCLRDENGCVHYTARSIVNKIFRKHPAFLHSCDNLLVL